MLVLFLAMVGGCGGEVDAPPAATPVETYADSPLVGRWSGGDLVYEFLADGTLVEYFAFESEHSIRNDDGTFRKEKVPGFRCRMGTFEPRGADRVAYALTSVGGLGYAEGEWTWRVEGATLALAEEGEDRGTFTRDDLPVPPAARTLVGLWRRTGSVTDHQDMGVRYTPGGLAIVVGRNAQWDNRAGGGSISWLCLASTWTIDAEGRLREDSPSYRDRPRARAFTVEGDRLTFGPARVYERVHGVVPLRDGRLDLDAWKAMR